MENLTDAVLAVGQLSAVESASAHLVEDVGECITADDVFLENVAEGYEVWTLLLSHLFEMLVVPAALHYHTAFRLCGVNCTACVSPLRGDEGVSESFWGWVLGEDILFESCTTRFSVVGQDVDAVAGADGDEALKLPFGMGFDVLQKGDFATEDFKEEAAVAAGGFEESAVESEDSSRTRSSMAFTSRGLVNTSQWSATLCRLLLCFVFCCWA